MTLTLRDLELNPHCGPVPLGSNLNRSGLVRCWVVDGVGRVKTVRFHANVKSPLIDVSIHTRSGRAVAMGKITINKDVEDTFSLLYDLYEAEGRLDDYKLFVEYQDNYQFMGGDDRDANGHVKPLADEYLPAEVISRRKGMRSKFFRLRPPTKKPQQEGRAK